MKNDTTAKTNKRGRKPERGATSELRSTGWIGRWTIRWTARNGTLRELSPKPNTRKEAERCLAEMPTSRNAELWRVHRPIALISHAEKTDAH